MLCQSIRNSSKSPAKASLADSRIQKDLHDLATARWTANCSVRITFPSTPHTHPVPSGSTATGQHASPHLHVLITPTTGAYTQSSFLFSIHLPSSYPFAPPHVRCLTPCLHPLLSFRTGRVYHPILHHDWKPVLSLNTVVFALQLLFHLHDNTPLIDGDTEVRQLMDGSGSGLFDVLIQQTLDGGFYFGMHWPRNRGAQHTEEEEEAEQRSMAELAKVEERKEYSPQHTAKRVEEVDDEVRKRRKRIEDSYSVAVSDERDEEAEDEEREEEDEDDRHRKHKQPHRHFLHRQTAVSPPALLHTVHRIRRVQREERKEEEAAVGGDEDARMTRADSFSFTALQSSLPGPHSPIPLSHSAAIVAAPTLSTSSSSSSSSSFSSFSASPSVYSHSSPTSSARLFALSSSSSSSSPALGSLAVMQRQHAMRTTLGGTRTQPVSTSAAGLSEARGDGSIGANVVRTLSSVMAD